MISTDKKPKVWVTLIIWHNRIYFCLQFYEWNLSKDFRSPIIFFLKCMVLFTCLYDPKNLVEHCPWNRMKTVYILSTFLNNSFCKFHLVTCSCHAGILSWNVWLTCLFHVNVLHSTSELSCVTFDMVSSGIGCKNKKAYSVHMAVTVKHFKNPADNYLFALSECMRDCFCFVFELLRITHSQAAHRNNRTQNWFVG